MLSYATATEILGIKDVIGEELEATNGVNGQEKTSHKSLPKVLGWEKSSNGVCCM